MNDHLTYLLLLHGCVAGAIACLMRWVFLRRQPGTSHVCALVGGTYLAARAAASKLRTLKCNWALVWRALQCASVLLLGTDIGFVTSRLRCAGPTRQQLREIMDRSLTPMALVDQMGCILYANPALANLWPSDSLPGSSLFALVAVTLLTEAIRTVRETGAWSGEILMRRSDGPLMIADASATLVTNGNGRQQESLWMLADWSALAAQLCQAQKMEPAGGRDCPRFQ